MTYEEAENEWLLEQATKARAGDYMSIEESQQLMEELAAPYHPDFIVMIEEAVKHRTGPMSYEEAVRRGYV